MEQHCINRYLRRSWVQQPDLFAVAGVAAAICSPHSCCWCGCLFSVGPSSHAINSSSSGGRRYSSTTAAASAPLHQHFLLPLRLLRPAPIAHPSFESGWGSKDITRIREASCWVTSSRPAELRRDGPLKRQRMSARPRSAEPRRSQATIKGRPLSIMGEGEAAGTLCCGM